MTLVKGRLTCTRCGADQEVSSEVLNGASLPLLEDIVQDMLASPEAFVCADCIIKQDQKEMRERKAEERREKAAAARDAAAIPPIWYGKGWEELEEDPERRDAIRAARAWAEGRARRPGLLLYGRVGRGKSMIAGVAASSRLSVSQVRWMNTARLIQDLGSGFGSPQFVAAQRVLSSLRRGAFVLDDLDKVQPTEHAVRPIYLAINEWVELGRPLLITSNKDPEGIATDFGSRFGEAIASRLIEHCNVYHVGGRDRRVNP